MPIVAIKDMIRLPFMKCNCDIANSVAPSWHGLFNCVVGGAILHSWPQRGDMDLLAKQDAVQLGKDFNAQAECSAAVEVSKITAGWLAGTFGGDGCVNLESKVRKDFSRSHLRLQLTQQKSF